MIFTPTGYRSVNVQFGWVSEGVIISTLDRAPFPPPTNNCSPSLKEKCTCRGVSRLGPCIQTAGLSFVSRIHTPSCDCRLPPDIRPRPPVSVSTVELASSIILESTSRLQGKLGPSARWRTCPSPVTVILLTLPPPKAPAIIYTSHEPETYQNTFLFNKQIPYLFILIFIWFKSKILPSIYSGIRELQISTMKASWKTVMAKILKSFVKKATFQHKMVGHSQP